jgi:hypothetical protein
MASNSAESIAPIGFGDGAGLFYLNRRSGWVSSERFVRVHHMCPSVYCDYHYGDLQATRSRNFDVPLGELVDPYPNEPTFLGFLNTAAEDCLGYAVFLNLHQVGLVHDLTLDSPVRGRRTVPRIICTVPPRGWAAFAPSPGRVMVTVVRISVVASLPPQLPVLTLYETFVGAFDGGNHYYAGPHAGPGWVTQDEFVNIHGRTPRDYCYIEYRPVIDGGACAGVIGKHLFPNPHPGHPTYLGLMLLSGNCALAIFVNAGWPRPGGNEAEFSIRLRIATRFSPRFQDRHFAPSESEFGPPEGARLEWGTMYYVARDVRKEPEILN